jgi:integrase
MKTDNGKNRTVPIHKKIRHLVEDAYDTAKTNGCELLFCGLNYRQYVYRFKKIVVTLDLNPEHRAHDPRKTFVTLCKKANVDEYAIKKMVGHSISDLTEKIYTDRDINWLREELDKV